MEMAVVAIFCILTIFLFPVMQGPYSAVNGPVTALQAARAALRLRLAIVYSALKSSLNLSFLIVLFWLNIPAAECEPNSPAVCGSVLRC